MSLPFKECPKCHENTNKWHLMMGICDNCLNIKDNAPEKYIEHTSGILVLNPKWVSYMENN